MNWKSKKIPQKTLVLKVLSEPCLQLLLLLLVHNAGNIDKIFLDKCWFLGEYANKYVCMLCLKVFPERQNAFYAFGDAACCCKN